MRRFTALFLLGIILILNINVFAQKDVSIDKNTSVKATEEAKEEKKKLETKIFLYLQKTECKKQRLKKLEKLKNMKNIL